MCVVSWLTTCVCYNTTDIHFTATCSTLTGAYQHPAMINATSYSYQSSTPMMAAAAPQLTFAMDKSRDFTDSSRNEDSSSSSRGRSRSFSIQDKRPNVEQVTGKRRTSLCYIGSSKSDPVNVLNATGKE